MRIPVWEEYACGMQDGAEASGEAGQQENFGNVQGQPEAEIILEANLHVTTKYSAENEIFNNDNINRMNEGTRQIVEKYGFAYLDVNTLFDEAGMMSWIRQQAEMSVGLSSFLC